MIHPAAKKSARILIYLLPRQGELWYNSLCDIRAVRCPVFLCAMAYEPDTNVYEGRRHIP